LASVAAELRSDLDESASALVKRLDLFRSIIDRLPGWQVASMGGFYAYVEFPSAYITQASLDSTGQKGKIGSEDVARYLAEELGVVCLPGSFFMPDLKDEKVWTEIEAAGGGELRSDRWLRYVCFE
jgi:aspartate/methionine/tyrosine aminotransferase